MAAHIFRVLLPGQRRQRSGYSENHSNVAQLIIRLVTNHILLIIIIGIDSQIYSKLKLANFRFSSKNAWIISQINHRAIRNLRTLASVINRQNGSLFHMFCRSCQITCALSFRQSIRFINIFAAISASCPIWLQRQQHHHHHYPLRVRPW